MFFNNAWRFWTFFNTEHYLSPFLCSGINFSEKSVKDTVTNRELKLNKTSHQILKFCADGRSISDIKNKMEHYYKCKDSRVNNDVSSFLNHANSKFLINYKIKEKSNLISYLICKFNLIFWQRRYEIHSDNLIGIILRMMLIVFNRFFIYFLISNVSLLFTILISSIASIDTYSDSLLQLLLYLNMFFLGIFSGIAFHEGIHVFIYRRKHRGQGFMGKKGISLAFYREDNYKKISIKLMGGLIVGVAGVLGLTGTWLLPINSSLLSYVFFSTYAIHLINLLPIWGDGKELIEMLIKQRFHIE